MNIPSTMSTRLDEAMTKAGFSQSSLARASGVPQPTINRILKGPTKRGPETETIRKLAQACNVSFDWLNEGAGEASRAGLGNVREMLAASPSPPVQDTWLQRVNTDEALLLDLFRGLSKPKQAAVMGYVKIAAGKATAEGEALSTRPDQAEHGAKRK